MPVGVSPYLMEPAVANQALADLYGFSSPAPEPVVPSYDDLAALAAAAYMARLARIDYGM